MRPTTAPPPQTRAHTDRGPGPGPTPRSASGYDRELAKLFTELRLYLGISVATVAQHVATHPNTIAALEAGRVDLLPPWSETARVVSAYIGIAGLDPRPALDRLAAQMGVVVTPAARTAPAAFHEPFKAAVARPAEPLTPVARILGRLSEAAVRIEESAKTPSILTELVHTLKETGAGLMATLRDARAPVRWVLAGAVGLILIGSAAPSGVLQASVTGLSDPISGLWRSLSGKAGEVRVQIRNGFKWIDAEDPRARRGDKLPSRGS